MTDSFKRFDMAKEPVRQWLILRDFIKAVSWFKLRIHKTSIRRTGVDALKPPYLLLCNHNAFFDFFVASTCVWPARANFVVAIDGFTTPSGKNGFTSRETIMRLAGCICKRKFTSDTTLVRNLMKIIDNGDVPILYPEARYSLCGTDAVLPESLGKLCKLLKVPVVTLICHGHHVNSPFWHVGNRGVKPTEAEFSLFATPDQLKEMSVEEINRGLDARFTYDDFRWLEQSGQIIDTPTRAEGLHKVLYQCPHCGKEYRMGSEGDTLFCSECGKRWKMGTDGSLAAENGDTEFAHIPDWYEWERQNVRKEVESGTYGITCPVHVESLPNSKGYIHLGKGTMTHGMDGFHVSVDGPYGHFEMDKPVASMYSCHIEYDYLGRYGDCVDLNTLEDTWYTYPEIKDFSVTKMALATEELYRSRQ
ncbi:MAG: 1-acyl-sn-glycerol-3-phosphate acyltransferase [Bacteroidales bacterium]|jgi:hypothetical protein|nr:1-acyl-sn-glycerol-3-phosphate acyltransferase [Bacteroidales bacterium]